MIETGKRLFTRILLMICVSMLITIPSYATPDRSDPEVVIQTYLNNLSAGRYDDAVDQVNLDDMIDYLLTTRMAQIKQQNPDLTESEETAMIKQFREKEVSDERVRQVIHTICKEQEAEGYELQLDQMLESKSYDNAFIANYSIIDENGRILRQRKIGVQEIDGQWYIAPHLMEQILMQNAAKQVTPPEGLIATADTFWESWKTGELDEAYKMLDKGMRKQVSLLTFLEGTRQSLNEWGLLESWTVGPCYQTNKNQYNTIFTLRFSRNLTQAMIGFYDDNGTWIINGMKIPFKQQPGVPIQKQSK